ncbi:putative cytochrome p450 [Lyophyllum shimeji]|uniref:Cytochrome p450 n=1 Tax=Lyophyllum shimeji TaxID=47721 RepID=A0A9P3PXB9_LYOSH|nr:putative cytochrome p450 [Lyophyllum shimeji]
MGYQPHQLAQARVLAGDLLSRPEDKENIFIRFSTAIITQIAYGHQVTSTDDPYVKLAEEVGKAVALAGYASGLADTFPVLQYFPSWFPGTHYIYHARRSAPMVQEFINLPFLEVQKKKAAGIAKPLLVASQPETLDQGSDESGITIDDIKGARTMAYFGGAETVNSRHERLGSRSPTSSFASSIQTSSLCWSLSWL